MTEVNEHLEVPMTAQEADIRYADITNIRAEMEDVLEQEIELENLSRRFRFKSGEDEFWYLQNYGYNYTPAQAMANNIMEVADKVAISHVLGNKPRAVINAFGAISKEEQGIIQGLGDEIFPKVMGFKADSVGVVTSMNLIHAGTRLAKAIANPIYQGAFGVTDYQNAVLHVAQKTSVFNSISNIFKSPPDFTKAIAKIPESDKITLKRALNELKLEFTAINASSYGIASPNGKIAATTKFIRELEFKINGSHQADDVVRKFITKSYAYLLKDAYKSGRQVLEGVDNKLLANAVDQNGFLNPYKLLNSTQSDERKLGFDLLAKYHEGVDAVNPNSSKAWGSVSKDSAGAFSWVRMSGWMMKVMQRTNLPILKSLASSQVRGVAKARMGSILL